jgi:uncharacterized protein DUF6922
MTKSSIRFKRDNSSPSEPIIDSFSKNLFWDVDQTTYNPKDNLRWLFQRVIEYGTINDWQVIFNYYGLTKIAEELKKVRSLEPRALNFIASLSNTPLEEFKCYTRRSSSRKHWIY